MKYSKNKKSRLKIQKGSGIIKPGEMGICDLCGEEDEKIMVSAFNCNPKEPEETRALHTYCVDCVNSWIEAEPKNGAPLEISMREKKCPECRAPVIKTYVEQLIEKLPHAAEDTEQEELLHFRPLSPSSNQFSLLDPILFTGAVLSLRNNAIHYLFHNRGSSQNIISLTLLFILTLYNITTSLRSSSGINPLSRVTLVLILLSSEYAVFQNNLQDLVDMFQGPSFPTITYPGQRGGGKKSTNEHVQAVNLSISFPKNATQKEIKTFCGKFFSKLFNPKIFPIIDTEITLPDVKFKMDDVHKSVFYKKLMQFNHMKSKSGKRTVKHGRTSMSSRTRSIRSSRSTRSQYRSI
jgi:hypothetical protein